MPPATSKNTVGLGRAIANRRAKEAKQQSTSNSHLHTVDLRSGKQGAGPGLNSVTHQGDLEDFLATAQLAETDFTAERRNNVTVVQAPHLRNHLNPFLLTSEQETRTLQRQQQERDSLRVPRRPKWTASTTPQQLSRAERDSFLEWRRSLARLTDREGFVLTPFERNLEVWRQLWRVVERSHLVVQIVDARNPLKFRCEDLERYVTSLPAWVGGDDEDDDEGDDDDDDEGGRGDAPVGDDEEGWQDDDDDEDGDEEGEDEERSRASRNAATNCDASSSHPSPSQGPRRCLLLINKADLLTESQRRTWADYFARNNVRFAFFSAADAAALQEAAAALAEGEPPRSADEASDSDEDSEEGEDDGGGGDEDAEEGATGRGDPHVDGRDVIERAELAEAMRRTGLSSGAAPTTAGPSSSPPAAATDAAAAAPALARDDPTRVLNVTELEELFLSSAPPLSAFARPDRAAAAGAGAAAPPTQQLHVGLVGYPNVGKSSTINALLGAKKVSVSSTPGKTKHFQTLHVSPRLVLCDCPGLVFPQFATTPAELVCDGILPIDQMREYTAPGALVQQRVPHDILEAEYGVRLAPPDEATGSLTGLELLTAVALARGFVRQGQGGNPDESRSARYVLKDYVRARLLYCHPPPGVDGDEFNEEARQRWRQRLQGRRFAPLAQRDEGHASADGPGAPTRNEGAAAAASVGAGSASAGGARTRAVDRSFFATHVAVSSSSSSGGGGGGGGAGRNGREPGVELRRMRNTDVGLGGAARRLVSDDGTPLARVSGVVGVAGKGVAGGAGGSGAGTVEALGSKKHGNRHKRRGKQRSGQGYD